MSTRKDKLLTLAPKLITKLFNAIAQKDGGLADLSVLRSNLVVEKVARLLIAEREKQQLRIKYYTLRINYDCSLLEMIGLSGCELSRDVYLRSVRLRGAGIVEVMGAVVCFNKPISTIQIKKRLRGLGLRPAGVEHLCALVQLHPPCLSRANIVALGTPLGTSRFDFDKDRYYPALMMRSNGCCQIDGEYETEHWREGCCFLALQKD